MPPHYRNHNSHQAPVVLNVAEKPSVARALQQVFHRMQGARDQGMRRDGPCQVFTHENVHFPAISQQGHGQLMPPGTPSAPHTMITTAVRGHLASQDFDSSQFGWSKCEPVALFQAPIETYYKDDMKTIERMLARLSSQVNYVILWLDCDREGEAIGDEVRQACQRGNPHLTPNVIFRAKFSTVLAPEIERALRSLGRLQESLVDAVQLRSELDLRVGAAFTRFQTLRLQDQFEYDGSSVLSYGPCQFPTLGFVVERWARIETFVPQDFWTIDLSLCPSAVEGNPTANNNNNSHQQRGRPIYFNWKRGRLYDQLIATVLYESCLESGQAVVTSMNGRPKNKWRPVPLATVELQKRASRFLRIGSEQLMEAAEQLYQKGLISYPRTETERFRPEFQHQPLFQQFVTLGDQCTEFSAYAQKLLSGSFQNPRAGQHDDQAHPPITPCKAVDPNSIGNAIERGVYTLVVKHYLACCSRDAVGKETTLAVRMASEEFTATGLMVLEQNWLEIYQPWERWSTGQGELPRLETGSRITPDSLILKSGSTSPPSLLSEVDLISLMDRNGIGTDATIATHIATIQERSYAVKDNQQKFTPTKLGIALIQGYNSMGYQLNKPDLRREMEAECNLVAAGRKAKQEVLVPLLSKMKQTFQTALAEATKLDDAMAHYFSRIGASNLPSQLIQARFSLCGVCNNAMDLKQQQRGGRNNNNGNNVRKLLYCQTCNDGCSLPRNGTPQPHTSPNNNNSPTRCLICNYQVLKIQQGEGYDGPGYNVCPKCYSAPPPEHGGGTGPFRCFECQNSACPLSSRVTGGDLPVFDCPFCRMGGQASMGQIKVKTNSRGLVLSCSRYSQDRCPYTIWLPKECQSVSVVAGDDENQNSICPRCSNSATSSSVVRLLKFQWKPGSLPPHFGRESTVCILCDNEFRRELSISMPQPGQVQARPVPNNRGRGGGRNGGDQNWRGGRGSRGGRGGNNGRGRGGRGNHSDGQGNVCYKCGEPGHFANNCPNR